MMKKKLTKIGDNALMIGKKYAPTMLLLLLTITARAAGGEDEISNLWKDEIQPIYNRFLGIALLCGVGWCAVMFMWGKKQALTIGGYVLLGCLVFRLLPGIAETILGIDLSSLIG